MRALGFEPKKEEIQKMISVSRLQVDPGSQGKAIDARRRPGTRDQG